MDDGRRAAGGGRRPIVYRPSSIVHRLLALVALVALGLNYWLYFVQMPVDPAVWKSFYPVQTQIATHLRDLADSEGSAALRQVYTYADMERDPVFLYLAHGLSPAFFDNDRLSMPAEPGAVFLLGGYTYQTDVVMLARYLGPAPQVTLRGPPFPGMETPSFLGFSAR